MPGAGMESSKRAVTVAGQGLSGRCWLNQGFVEDTTVKATLILVALWLGLAGLGAVAQAAEVLTAVSGERITEEMIRADVAAGAPVTADGRIKLLHYTAWLDKDMPWTLAPDGQHMTPTGLIRLVNSTPVGPVRNPTKVNPQMNTPGPRFSDGRATGQAQGRSVRSRTRDLIQPLWIATVVDDVQ